MKQAFEWSQATLLQSALFTPLHPVIAELGKSDFPGLQDCNAMLAKCCPPIGVQNGMALRFVAQQSGRFSFESQYEPRSYLTGEVQMRANNWHDLFNALVWLTFPKAKAVINSRHYHALIEQQRSGNARRGSVRDVNTLLDESGVIVVYSDTDLAALLRNFQWKELFWRRREQTKTAMSFYLFGHGLYEKALQPYVGLTGQGLLIQVKPEYFSWRPAIQMSYLDSLLADYLAEPRQCCCTRDLAPVPLLGVPGWAEDNDSATYYDNTAYFRSGRRT